MVRATLQRGTIHLLDSGDYPVWRAALSDELAALPRGLGPAARAVDVPAVRAVAEELFRGRALRFGELRPLLAERFPGADPHTLGVFARMTVPLVLPPTEAAWGWSGDPAFVRADEWIAMPDVDRESAREQLVLAHLAAFGPARAADVAAWSGMRSVQVVLDRLAPRLVRLVRRVRSASCTTSRTRHAPTPTYRLRPDCSATGTRCCSAHAEHSRVVDAEVRRRLMTANGRLRQSFMVDGRVVGGWSVAQAGRRRCCRWSRTSASRGPGLTSAAEEAARLLAWLTPDATDPDVRVLTLP